MINSLFRQLSTILSFIAEKPLSQKSVGMLATRLYFYYITTQASILQQFAAKQKQKRTSVI